MREKNTNLRRALAISLHQPKPGSSHNGTIYSVGSTFKGSGWQRVYCNTVTGNLLHPAPICDPFTSLTVLLAKCFTYSYSIFKVSLYIIMVRVERSRPPPPIVSTTTKGSALSSRNPILSPHWLEAIDGWKDGMQQPIRKRETARVTGRERGKIERGRTDGRRERERWMFS